MNPANGNRSISGLFARWLYPSGNAHRKGAAPEINSRERDTIHQKSLVSRPYPKPQMGHIDLRGCLTWGFRPTPPTNPRRPKLIQTRFNELFFEESLSTFYVVICQGGLTRAGAVYYFTHRLPGSFVLLKNREIPTGGESARCHRASRRVGRLARESMWRTYSASRL